MTKMMTVPLPDWPWQEVRGLAERLGVRVWLVGGAVRDALLGRWPVHDWDFAVDRDGLRLARAVADDLDGAYFPLDTERGTGRAIMTAADGSRIELDFALLRGADLKADLMVRDFTINALAMDQTGALVDLTGSQADLQARLVRATSERAFRDDPVRLLRAVRVAAELEFGIDPQTEAWMRRDAALLNEPSPERVRDELVRILTLPNAALHVERLNDLGLLAPLLPEVTALKQISQTWPHRFDVWKHTLHILDALEGVVAAVTGQEVAPRPLADPPPVAWGDVARVLGQFAGEITTHLAVEVSSGRDRWAVLKLAALLHDIGKPQTQSRDEEDERIHFYNHDLVGASIAVQRMQALRFSREEMERVRVIVGQHLRPAHLAHTDAVTRRAVYRYFRATGCAGVDVALLSLADHLSTWGPNLEEERWSRRLHVAETLLTHCFERYEETVEPPPLVTGHDLMDSLALEPGPQIGRLLETIREAQAAGEVRTTEEGLALARRISSQLDKPAF